MLSNGLSRGAANRSYVQQQLSGVPDFSMMPHWTAAKARALSGKGPAKLFCIGDSTTYGRGASGSQFAACRAGSYPVSLAAILNARGLPSNADNFVCTSSASGTVTYDPRVVENTGWVETQQSLGSAFFYNDTSTNALALTPVGAFDTMVVTYLRKTASGSVTVNVDGGATLATINTAGTNLTYASTTVSCTLGTHTINIAPTATGTDHYIHTVQCYSSAAPGVCVFNFGQNGALCANFDVAGGFGALAALAYYAPDLCIIELTINDSYLDVTPLATYTNELTAIVASALTTSDVVLGVGNPYSGPPADYASYVGAVYGIATEFNLPLVDISRRWQSYATMNPLMAYYDGFHPTSQGYYDKALAYASKIL
jgi:lysophospholipase L1-like esterase